nr:MAG TPA: Putative ATP dependent Clp protease [Caudoviricetes sp.]
MAVLKIYNDITSEEGKNFNKLFLGSDSICFKDIDEFISSMKEDDNNIEIKLHCRGGECTEGWAMYDKLRASGKNISAVIEGECASMASVILLAAPAESRKAYANASLCIHNPMAILNGAMTVDELQKCTEELQRTQDRILDIYVERTGGDRDELQALMNEDKYIDMERAKSLGFISSIIPPISAKKENSSINTKIMGKKETTVKKSILAKLLAKAGYEKIEDVKMVDMELTTADGSILTVEREEGEPQVGDAASPDGEFVMEDGTKIIVEDGVITDIIAPEESNENEQEVAALKAEIASLKEQLESAKSQAKSSEEKAIIDIVNQKGGKQWLDRIKNISSTYTPPSKAFIPGKNDEKINPLREEINARKNGTYNKKK